MALTKGTRLGVYEVISAIGAGGMGEVYKARDVSLGRDVAIKVLPPDVANDKDRAARFAREARTLAALDHPNIGAIHGWESSSGVQAIVMELVEGPTLRDRISAGPLALDEALGIARQIADALETAHDQGIVHRDLKPANIKVRADGRVKVLDFGLAKALGPVGPEAPGLGPAQDPTKTAPLTESGIALGTPAYMSPEQARGEIVTRKTDVWSFGVVLFEMLSGRHPFGTGASTEVVAAILRATPEWEMLPAGTPPAVTRLLRRCLEKDPRSRLHDIGDARLEIEDAISGRSSGPSGAARATGASVAAPRSLTTRIAALVGALAILAAATAGAYLLGERRAAPPAAGRIRLQIVAPQGTRFVSTPAVSPDGKMIAFVAATPGSGGQLWIRTLASPLPTPLTDTDGATFPFWNPDGHSIAFFAGGKIKRVNITGTDRPTVICDASSGRGGVWLDDGTIVFAPDAFMPLMRVSAVGGQPSPLTTIDKNRGEVDHRFPVAIPGGYLLYLVNKGAASNSGVRLVSLEAPNKEVKFYPGMSAPEYSDGYLVFQESGQVKARPIHLPDGELGAEVGIGVARTSVTAGRSALSAAAGMIALIDPGDATVGQLVWRGRDGSTSGTIGQPDEYNTVELSPNRQQLLTTRPINGSPALWVLSATGRGDLTAVFKGAVNNPLWSFDGSQIAFMTVEGAPPNNGMADVVSMPSTGGTTTVRVPTALTWARPVGWTRDGTFAWIRSRTGRTWDLWFKRPDQDSPVAYVQDGAVNSEGRLSADGSWMAYATDQSGRFDVVVRSFPSGDQKFVVSSTGGRFPRWRHDGRELYYLTDDLSTLMAVSVTPGQTPTFGPPQKLFDLRLVIGVDSEQLVFGSYQYDVGDDAGTRFLINQVVREPVQAVDVILNWNHK